MKREGAGKARKKVKGERGSGSKSRSPEQGEMGSMGGGRMGKEVEVKWTDVPDVAR